MKRFLRSQSGHAAAMLSVVAGAALCGSNSGTAIAQAAPQPEPTVLERVFRQPGSVVISAEEVGRLESADTRAAVTALVVENALNRPSRVRGVRIDLANNASTDRIYIDEQDLVHHLHELNSLDCSLEMMRDEPEPYHGTTGIARCRPSNEEPQRYCPSYRMGALSLSTFSGHTFTFPSIRPWKLAEAIDRALSEFGLDSDMPRLQSLELPRADRDRIFALAVRRLPELASSPGIKAAGYQDREKRSAWAVFWPYEKVGDMARSYSVQCSVTGETGTDWDCRNFVPRGYLTLPDQDAEVVIMGPLSRDKAVALVEFAKQALRDATNSVDADQWRIVSILPPNEYVESFHLVWNGGADQSITAVIDESPQGADVGFELLQLAENEQPVCGKDNY